MCNNATFMKEALLLAKKGEFTTRPNPAVGCVIVKQGVIIGRGYHVKAGEPHAEIKALADANRRGEDVKDATVYVTLEPCSHYGRTPPCVNALIENKVSRVVVATLDANPQVSGRGVAMLKEAGIEVLVGVCEHEAKSLNAGFLKAMATGLPYVRAKIAVSLDGRTAMADGDSKWITGDEAREDVQRLRAKSAAIITGSGTIIADNPALNVRLKTLDLMNISQPKVVVMDRRGQLQVRGGYRVFDYSNTLIWQRDIGELLRTLVAEHQCYDVLVEAGSQLTTSFLLEEWVDELVIYQAPCLLGCAAQPMFLGEFDKLNQKLKWTVGHFERLGEDLKINLKPNKDN